MISKSTIASIIILSAFTLPCDASTTFTLDAKKNCILTNAASNPDAYLKFKLPPGRYVFSLVENSMNCQRSPSDGCLIDTVFLRGGGTVRWGSGLTSKPMVVDSATSNYIAVIHDTNCSDNIGQATILAEKAL